MKLKKRTEKINGIKWDFLVSQGVEDNEHNRKRYKSGFALDLLVEVIKPESIQETKPEIDSEFLKELELSEQRLLEQIKEQKRNNE